MKKSSKVLWIFTGVIFAAFLILAVLNSVNYLSNPKMSSSFKFNFLGHKNITGNKNITSKTVALTAFDTVSIGSDFDVSFNPGSKNTVAITSDENILPYINISQNNHQLSIDVQPELSISPSQTEKAIITSSTPLHQIDLRGIATLHAMELNSDDFTLNMDGMSSAYLQGKIQKIHINLSGKSNLHLKLFDTEAVDLNITGMGTVYLSGNTQNLNISSSGKATVVANDLMADDVVISGSGMSDINVHAVKTLTISASGKSDIQYSGNPNVSRDISGDVSVEKNK